jgi:hypothetical protein
MKYRDYEVSPAGQQLRNDDGTPGRWLPRALVLHWRGNDAPPTVQVSWYAPDFDTERAAANYAAAAAKRLIDTGRCQV